MNTNETTTVTKPSTRSILSSLWVARMLSGLMGDVTRLNDPDAIKTLMEKSGDVVATSELLIVMSILMFIPIAMSFLSQVLKYPAALWTNRIVGAFFALFDLVFLAMAVFVWKSAGYEFVWSISYLLFTFLVAYYAWKWREPNAHKAMS